MSWTTIRLFFCQSLFQPSQLWVQIVVVMIFCSMLEINDVDLYIYKFISDKQVHMYTSFIVHSKVTDIRL